MILLTEGIPALPDLTHASELFQFGQKMIQLSQGLLVLLLGVGIVLGWLRFAYQRHPQPHQENQPFLTYLEKNLLGYNQIWRGVTHGWLIIAILSSGFFLCSTLANRYHHWEQEKMTKVAESVAGERVEQVAPQIHYFVEEPYSTITYLNGKPTEVEKKQKVDRLLPLSSAQVEVNLKQSQDPASQRLIYQSEFTANYQVINTLDKVQDFLFEVPPPTDYRLLQDYRVEQKGKLLQPENQGDYRFPLKLASKESANFRVSYKAQGAPRWVYSANGQSLAKFRLSILAAFPNPDFASGIVPSEIKLEEQGTRFIWSFQENVSVQYPFGVFTATPAFKNTGILPRLLLLAPGILFWWLMLLYLTGKMEFEDSLIAAALFFAILLSLTYFSRLGDAKLIWGLLLPIPLLFAWGLGRKRQTPWLTLGATLAGVILPVAGFLLSYTGITLAISGLLSIVLLLIPYFRTKTIH